MTLKSRLGFFLFEAISSHPLNLFIFKEKNKKDIIPVWAKPIAA
jgi:hypothetical protein